MITDLLLLTAIIVFVVDLSGWSGTLLDLLSRYLGKTVTDFKPFTCSLCMTFWGGLAYLLITNQVSIPSLALVCAMAFLSRPMAELLQKINDILIRLLQ